MIAYELKIDLRKLRDKTERDVIQAISAASRWTGEAMVDLVSEYPPAPGGRPLEKVYTRTENAGRTTRPFLSKFKSSRQQYYVLMLARTGRLPYARTGNLGASMTYRVRQNRLRASIQVGTAIPYATFVLGQPRTGGVYDYQYGMQTYYHQITGWTSLPLALNIYAGEIAETFKGKLLEELRK